MEYHRPPFLFTAHLETIYPALLRRVNLPPYTHERIQTADDDFLDLNCLRQGSEKVVIISHGLEGNSTRAYVKGMAKAFFSRNFDIVAWNFRGCGQDMNRQLRFYHSGATEDLGSVVQHAAIKGYKEIYLIGFSLGGNMTLKYLGEKGSHSLVKKAVAFSVPLDLHASCLRISNPSNRVYSSRFLKSLKNKIIKKSRLMPGLDITNIHEIRSLVEFDDRYTAPIHGFKDAQDYYAKCSAVHFLDSIKVPTLLVNARNDPFLTDSCFPEQQIKDHPFLHFETPQFGGHVGFTQFNKNGLYWSEERALAFLT